MKLKIESFKLELPSINSRKRFFIYLDSSKSCFFLSKSLRIDFQFHSNIWSSKLRVLNLNYLVSTQERDFSFI